MAFIFIKFFFNNIGAILMKKIINISKISLLVAASLGLSACATTRERCTWDPGSGKFVCEFGAHYMLKATAVNKISYDKISVADLSASNAFIDYSDSNVGQILPSSSPQLNVILKDGSAIVSTLSVPLNVDSSRTRLSLSNPSYVANWINANSGNFTGYSAKVVNVQFSGHVGNNNIVSEAYYQNNLVGGGSYAYYNSGLGDDTGGNQQLN